MVEVSAYGCSFYLIKKVTEKNNKRDKKARFYPGFFTQKFHLPFPLILLANNIGGVVNYSILKNQLRKEWFL